MGLLRNYAWFSDKLKEIKISHQKVNKGRGCALDSDHHRHFDLNG